MDLEYLETAASADVLESLELVSARARHAAAARAHDGGELAGAAGDFEALGALLLAYNLVAETMLEGAASARPIGS